MDDVYDYDSINLEFYFGGGFKGVCVFFVILVVDCKVLNVNECGKKVGS